MVTERMGKLNTTHRTLNIAALKAEYGPPPWSTEVVQVNGTRMVLICQPPGHPNDTHYHITDEWWYIVEGEQTWQFEDETAPHHVKAGDCIFAPANIWHHISVVGDVPAIRMAMSAIGEFHRYDRPGCAPVAKEEKKETNG